MSERCGHDAAAYALGALEPQEAEAFRRHLSSCVVCRDELAGFEHVVNALPMAAPQHAAPRALKRRVTRAVRAEPKSAPGLEPGRRRVAIPRPALASAFVLAVALAVTGGIELASTSHQSRLIQAQLGQAQVRLVGGRANLIVRHLPEPRAGRIYELWLQHGSGRPSPSTLFSVTSAGTADVGIPVRLQGSWRVMVTDEPETGSSTPTTPPVIVISS